MAVFDFSGAPDSIFYAGPPYTAPYNSPYFGFPNLGSAGAQQRSATSHSFTGSDGSKVIYSGKSFKYEAVGDGDFRLVSGIVTGVKMIKAGAALFEVSGISYDVTKTDVSTLANVFAGADLITGTSKAELIYGYLGADTIVGGGGKDTLDGGAGRDTVDYSSISKRLVMALDGSSDATVKVGNAAEDIIKNFENVVGGRGDDLISGDAGTNSLTGGAGRDEVLGKAGKDRLSGDGGKDTVSGGNGKDTINGGTGNDHLKGGGAPDRFVFSTKPSSLNVDKIEDFKHNTDWIALDSDIFKKIGRSLDASEFYAASGAHSAHDDSDRIVYNKSNGKLYYDADGKGGDVAIHFATLSNKATLDHGDFIIV